MLLYAKILYIIMVKISLDKIDDLVLYLMRKNLVFFKYFL